MESSKAAILQALIYADIFDYPLTEEEMWIYLVKEHLKSRDVFRKSLQLLSSFVESADGYFFLKGRKKIVAIRERRRRASDKKMRLAETVAEYFSHIPTVQFVGVSGAVAMQNAEDDDDIDLFLIVKKETIWISRLVALLILELLGKRRTRHSSVVKDLFCLNMFMDEHSLAFSDDRRSLYTAHEIIQLKPLFSRGETYEVFLQENAWVDHYLPHGRKGLEKSYSSKRKRENSKLFENFLIFPPVLQLSKFVQKVYMKKHKTNERVTDTVLAFHPYEYQTHVLLEFAKKLKRYNIPT